MSLPYDFSPPAIYIRIGGDRMKIQWKPLIISILIPLAVGALSALLTRDSMMAFSTLEQPPLSPPGWLFPVVWTILYILMGIASYLALIAVPEVPGSASAGSSGMALDDSATYPAIRAYTAQLVFNFGWSLIFFNLEWYLLAFFWLVILWVLILITTVRFYRLSPLAGLLMLPYLAWVTFAGYLNLGVWWLN